MFGGNYGYTSVEDMWIFTLEKLSLMLAHVADDQVHSDACKDLLYPDKKILNPWDWSCGSLADMNSTKQCRWKDVIRKAWCLKQYQSFVSPL